MRLPMLVTTRPAAADRTTKAMDRLNTSPIDDVLGAVLRDINVRSTVFCRSRLSAPWGFAVESSPVVKFHLVLTGSAWLVIDEQIPQALSTGDLVLLLRGDRHTVRSDPGADAPPLEDVLAAHPVDSSARMTYGGRGARTELLCGGFDVSHGLHSPAVLRLPRALVLSRTSASMAGWLDPIFAMVRDEAAAEAPGSAVLLAKLADVFLAQALRVALSLGTTPVDPLSPQGRDPAVDLAVELIRTHPEHAWTIDDLARRVGLSRSTFTAHFRAVTDMSPIQFLTRLRLSLAAGYLDNSSQTIDRIAHLVGYDNRTSLSKAFARTYGCSPAEYRKDRDRAPQVAAG